MKEKLHFATGDFHTVTGKLDKLFIDQYHNYNGKIEEAKARLSKKLRNRPFLRDLTVFVSSVTLDMMID